MSKPRSPLFLRVLRASLRYLFKHRTRVLEMAVTSSNGPAWLASHAVTAQRGLEDFEHGYGACPSHWLDYLINQACPQASPLSSYPTPRRLALSHTHQTCQVLLDDRDLREAWDRLDELSMAGDGSNGMPVLMTSRDGPGWRAHVPRLDKLMRSHRESEGQTLRATPTATPRPSSAFGSLQPLVVRTGGGG